MQHLYLKRYELFSPLNLSSGPPFSEALVVFRQELLIGLHLQFPESPFHYDICYNGGLNILLLLILIL